MDDRLNLPGRPFTYRARDADALMAAMLERAGQLMPEWTGLTSEADAGRVLLELFAHMGDILGYYTDAVANESFLGTAQTRRGVQQHLRLIGYELSTAVPATADLTVTASKKPAARVLVRPGDSFTTTPAPDSPVVRFEYAGAADLVIDPGDWDEVRADDGTVAGYVATRTVPVAEGRTVVEVAGVSDGTTGQRFALLHPRVILRRGGRDPDVTVDDGTPEVWVRQDTLAFSGPADPHFVVEVDDRDRGTVVFGDARPDAGAHVRIRYRVGGGEHGNVGPRAVGTVDLCPGLSGVGASVVNEKRAVGGAERETVEHAVRQGPAAFRSGGRAVTVADYESLALAYGGVGKVRVRSRPGGVVELIVAPQGGGDLDGTLKGGLAAYFDRIRAVGTRVELTEPAYVPIFLTMDVDVDPYFSNAQVEVQVRDAVRRTLSFDRSSFGQTIYLSKFYEAVEAVDGVAGVHVEEFNRAGDTAPIASAGKIALGETEVAKVPEPHDTVRADWTPNDMANGVRVTALGGTA